MAKGWRAAWLAAAAWAASCGAAAQNVTVYGIVDAAVEHLTNVGAGGDGLTRMPGLTGTLPSRLGFRGSEDLGGGLRAVFTLEQGFGLDTGGLNQGGRAFGRQAWVGLSGRWGTLSFGRQYTMLFWSLLDADVMGPGLYGTGSLDAYIPNARADNAVAWRGTFDGLTLGATFSVGRDTAAGGNPAATNCAGESAGDRRACREWSAMAKYDADRWGVALAVDTIHGGAGAFAGLASGALEDRRVSANGHVKFGRTVKVALGAVRRDNDASAATSQSDLWYAGIVVAPTPAWTFDGELLQLRYDGSADRATLVAARASYALSRRSTAYATAGRIVNRGALALSVSGGAAGGQPVSGGSQSGIAVGMRHAF